MSIRLMGGVNLVDRPAGAWPGPRQPGGAQCHHHLRRPAPLGSPQTHRAHPLGSRLANDWFVVNQLAVQGSKFNRRPDVVVYVNGLCC